MASAAETNSRSRMLTSRSLMEAMVGAGGAGLGAGAGVAVCAEAAKAQQRNRESTYFMGGLLRYLRFQNQIRWHRPLRVYTSSGCRASCNRYLKLSSRPAHNAATARVRVSSNPT